MGRPSEIGDYSTSEYTSSQQSGRRSRIGPTNAFVEFKREETEQSISERFEQQVTKYPAKIAIKTTNGALTYDELNKAANRVARAILAERGERGEPVALLLGYDTRMIVGVLGVLKAGKICVPLALVSRRKGCLCPKRLPGKPYRDRQQELFSGA